MLAALVAQPIGAVATGEFSEAAFASAQAEGRTILVETYAPWCLACRIQSPILARQLARAPFDAILVLRIGEKTPSAAWKRFRLKGYGTLVLFKGGLEAARGTPTTEEAVTAMLSHGI